MVSEEATKISSSASLALPVDMVASVCPAPPPLALFCCPAAPLPQPSQAQRTGSSVRGQGGGDPISVMCWAEAAHPIGTGERAQEAQWQLQCQRW